jgi:hypothetical protein
MTNLIRIVVVLAFSFGLHAQEFNATVVVNAVKTGSESLPIFKNLEKQLTDFINNTSWTGQSLQNSQRINCSFVILVSEYRGDKFKTQLQISASRPVFDSSYESTIYNYNDKNFDFNFISFQNIIFNPSQFESNLASVITFHLYMILGMDADSFVNLGGDKHYLKAQKILDYSQSSGYEGWSGSSGQQSRFTYLEQLLSPTFRPLRNSIYEYHRLGLDTMTDNPEQAKIQIANAILSIQTISNRRPNSFAVRVFFDSKGDEIADIFSDGPQVPVDELLTALTQMAPTSSDRWRRIKF